ncbi:MAG: hypothetical protein D6696_17305 [Acidobacteria bacterium]|nr:MAG: hypothetical protein D6696_17305 [Acidobacteriota bacterium]
MMRMNPVQPKHVQRSTRAASRALAALLLSLLAAPAGAEPLPAIHLDELQTGQKGYGLSVFAGTEPARFEVEVIGVMKNRTAELSYIMARLSGQGLETMGVASGMSGSPVYIDGRLAGAVSFSFLFSQGAIAGITPIEGMRRLGEVPVAPLAGAQATSGDAPSLAMLARGSFPQQLLEQHLSRLASPHDARTATTVHWQATGFGQPVTQLLERTLERFSSGLGGSAPAAAEPPPLVPGGAVAMVLVRGDLSLAAHGTVTDVDGDRIYAFGHPVLGLGPMRVPMAPAEVVTTVPSIASSFKIANVGPIVGAFDQDREAGVRGQLGLVAPTFPLDLHLRGLSRRDYRVEIAELPALVGGLVATTIFGGLTAGSYSSGDMGIDLEARFDLAGHPDLVLEQSFDGASAGLDSAVYVLTFASYLMSNDLEVADLEGIDVTLTQSARPRAASLVGAHPDRQVVEPGDEVTITLELKPYRGAVERRTIEVGVPPETPAGRYVLLAGDGSSIDALRTGLEPRNPATLSEALAILNGYHSRRQLVVLGVVPARGLTVAGAALPDLPAAVRSIFGSRGPSAATPLALTILDQHEESWPRPLDGVVRIDLEVRHRPR